MKLIDVNIERSNHLDRIEAFLREEQADIVCMQEVIESDLPRLSAAAGPHVVFAPMIKGIWNGKEETEGVCIISRTPLLASSVHYYQGTEGTVPVYDPAVPSSKMGQNHILLTCDIEHEGVEFRIATTHMPVSPPPGDADERQRAAVRRLLPILEAQGELIFCGDFNAPRPKEIYQAFAVRYEDNVPPEYTNSIDQQFHRNAPLERMVDYIFSTPGYAVSDVRMVCGVSDHCALVADILKA